MTHLTTPLKPRFKQAPAHQQRLADDIYEQILSAILEGDIVPGERMVQESVAREINVSRTPVREALLRLEHEGIIEGSNRRGFSIRRFTEAEVRELYMAREAVEGYSARRVAALNLTSIYNNDFWLQLKVGQMIRADGVIPRTILFCFTQERDLPFVAHEWLSSVITSWLYDHVGVESPRRLRAVASPRRRRARGSRGPTP